MGDVHVPAHVESLTIDAVVIRADGTREDHGRVVEYQRNPPSKTRKFFEAAQRLATDLKGAAMADDNGVNPGTVLGQYRIEVADENGTSHYGPVYSTRDEANGDLQAAINANPDATCKVVALHTSESGKTAKWEQAGD